MDDWTPNATTIAAMGRARRGEGETTSLDELARLLSADDDVPTRRRALFDRIIAMDEPALAAMERCAGMIEGMH